MAQKTGAGIAEKVGHALLLEIYRRKVLRHQARCRASKVEGGACPTFFLIPSTAPCKTPGKFCPEFCGHPAGSSAWCCSMTACGASTSFAASEKDPSSASTPATPSGEDASSHEHLLRHMGHVSLRSTYLSRLWQENACVHIDSEA